MFGSRADKFKLSRSHGFNECRQQAVFIVFFKVTIYVSPRILHRRGEAPKIGSRGIIYFEAFLAAARTVGAFPKFYEFIDVRTLRRQVPLGVSKLFTHHVELVFRAT